jgi:hypothetical protein
MTLFLLSLQPHPALSPREREKIWNLIYEARGALNQ